MTRNWIYYGIFLDEESKEKLLDECEAIVEIPDDWKIYCDHMTLVFNSIDDHIKERENVAASIDPHLGETVELVVDSIGISDDAIAFGVDYPTENEHSHITVATSPGTPPVKSNLIEKWVQINSFTVNGKINVVRPRR